MTLIMPDTTAKHISEWCEEEGDVLWWTQPITEPPYVGTPLDCGHTVEVITRFYRGGKVIEEVSRHDVGGWPGYHTHWTRFDKPTFWRKKPRAALSPIKASDADRREVKT